MQTECSPLSHISSIPSVTGSSFLAKDQLSYAVGTQGMHPQLDEFRLQSTIPNALWEMLLLCQDDWLDNQKLWQSAGESGTSNTVPSTAMTRSPPKKAPGVSGVAKGRTMRSNN